MKRSPTLKTGITVTLAAAILLVIGGVINHAPTMTSSFLPLH